MAEATKLTETLIRKAKLGPKQKQEFLWDTLAKGFGVRILPGGSAQLAVAGSPAA